MLIIHQLQYIMLFNQTFQKYYLNMQVHKQIVWCI